MNEPQDLNKLTDILIDYIREYQLKKFDPFYMREKLKFDINEYGMNASLLNCSDRSLTRS